MASAWIAIALRPMHSISLTTDGDRVYTFRVGDGLLVRYPLISFFADPVSYVGRAVEERDTCYFAAPEEPNRLNVDQLHFLQVQHDLRFALRDLLLQFHHMLRPHSPNESNRRDGPIGISFDLQGHVRSFERSTSVGVAIPMPFVNC